MQKNCFHIFIIEDDAVFRRGLARIFSGDGFTVTQFSDGKQALDSLKQVVPDLILCDYRLPGVDGIEVLRVLHQHDQPIPFILMTAYYTGHLVEEATAEGALMVVEKPFELEKFKKCCIDLLENNKLQKDSPPLQPMNFAAFNC